MTKRIFLDLETTGTNPGKHGIHQIAGCIEINGEVVESFNFKVKPNPAAQIDPVALEIAKVTTEQIMAYEPMIEVYKKLTSILGRYVDKFNKKDKFHIVGYNNRKFDEDFFRGFFLQNGDNFFGSWFWPDSMDVMVMASEYLEEERSEMKDFKLSTVAERMLMDADKPDESKLHDADYDIYLTRQVFYAIKRLRS